MSARRGVRVAPLRRPARRAPSRAKGRRGRGRRALRWLAVGAGVLVAATQVSDVALGFRPATDGCRVLYVVDGDTIDFHCPTEGIVRARITGFDAPELYAPQCRTEAASALMSQTYLRWTLGTADRLQVVLGGTDRYGRRLAEVFIDDDRLADRMIGAGHARAYDGGRRAGWCG